MIAYIAIPALVALIVKLALLWHAFRSPARNITARLFLTMLVVFALHNLSEFLLLNYYAQYGLTPMLQNMGFLYIALIIPAAALVLYVSLRLSLDFAPDDLRTKLLPLLFVPAAVLLFLLLFTDRLVVGFRPFMSTLLRIPGPWYILFEIYFVGCFLVALAILFYGVRAGRASIVDRLRSRWWLIALAPTALLMTYLIIANHFGLAKLSSTIYMPITWTFFLIVTTFVTSGSWKSLPTQQYRLFDIDFFLPWSKVRRRKLEFYDRIEKTILELAGLASVDDALVRVARVLRCPVALVGGRRPVLAFAGEGSLEMAQFPHEPLERIDHIVVANEIAESMPVTHQLMKRFKVAAVVPYHPRTKSAASWLLLGDPFSDSVYTPLDFKNVERLFDILGEFFLDKLGLTHAEIMQTEDNIRRLHDRLDVSTLQLEKALEETELLRAYNLRLLRENRAVHSVADARSDSMAPTPSEVTPKATPDAGKTLDQHVGHFEAQLIREALQRCDGRKSEAARLLGLRPNTLYYKLRKYRLESGQDNQGKK